MPSIANTLVFPEDEGNGVPSGESDYSSASYFGGLAAHPSMADYVARGMNIQKVGSGTFDITAGLAFILYEGYVDVQDGTGSYSNADEECELQIDGTTVSRGDTVNFKTN